MVKGFVFVCVFGSLFVWGVALGGEEGVDNGEEGGHKAVPVGSSGGMMNPDLSVVAVGEVMFTDNKEEANRNLVRVREVEVALQGYLYPGIRADVIPALEMEYEEDGASVEVDLEEAYVSVSEIPYVSERIPLEIQCGRKFMNFGRHNGIHPHHWAFADTPLVLRNFFGDHPWFDDGVQGSVTVSNPWDFYLKTTLGIWNGKALGHAHGDEDGDEGHEDHDHEAEEDGYDEEMSVVWDGRVFLSRSVLGISFGRSADTLVGYSLAWDEGRDTVLHGGDLTFNYRFPGTYRKIRWLSEFMAADIGLGDYTRYGGLSMLAITLTKFWEVGCRYDSSQVLDPHEDGDEWAASGFVTYHFTHAFYLKGQYRFRSTLDDREEHSGYLQLVFGLGPHSHRLQD